MWVSWILKPRVLALSDYRKRWGIECLFGDAKTRGFNIEDTHITNPDKLATLIVVIMLATIWAYRCATETMGMKAIPRKTPWQTSKVVVPHRSRRPQGLDHQQAQSCRRQLGH